MKAASKSQPAIISAARTSLHPTITQWAAWLFQFDVYTHLTMKIPLAIVPEEYKLSLGIQLRVLEKGLEFMLSYLLPAVNQATNNTPAPVSTATSLP